MFLYAVPDKVVFKKWAESSHKNQQIRKHVLIRNPTATEQKLFISYPTTDRFSLAESSEHPLKQRSDAEGRRGYEFKLPADGTLPLVVIFNVPVSREEMHMNFRDGVYVFSMFTTLLIQIKAIAVSDAAAENQFFPQELDIPRGPNSDYFFATEPTKVSQQPEFKLTVPEIPSILGALNEVSRLRQKDDNWKPMSSLEPHEAAIEQLIHDDADDDFGAMEEIEQLHDLSFSDSDRSTPSTSPRPSAQLFVPSLKLIHNNISTYEGQNKPRVPDPVENITVPREASAAGTLRSALGLGIPQAPAAMASTSVLDHRLKSHDFATSSTSNYRQPVQQMFQDVNDFDNFSKPSSRNQSSASSRRSQTSVLGLSGGNSFIMEMDGQQFDEYGRVISTKPKTVEIPAAAVPARPSRRASSNSVTSDPITTSRSSSFSATMEPRDLSSSQSFRPSAPSVHSAPLGQTKSINSQPQSSMSQSQRLANTLARSHQEHSNAPKSTAVPAHLLHLLENDHSSYAQPSSSSFTQSRSFAPKPSAVSSRTIERASAFTRASSFDDPDDDEERELNLRMEQSLMSQSTMLGKSLNSTQDFRPQVPVAGRRAGTQVPARVGSGAPRTVQQSNWDAL